MAYVLSSVSGNLISAASAGYAPTNSGDVSAIASAYQVVSATATQLYAGTAYVTSVNDAPISAARAGNAANASLANSAYYDGTGRLISSLPDSATVSAIASAYAESAASSKQDTLTFGYNASNQISSIDGSALAGEGGGTTYVSPSGTVWISGSSIEGTDSAYFPEREETNLAYSATGVTSILDGFNAYTATGANIVYATGDWLNGTISALANNVLVAKSSYNGIVTMFSASAESGPLVLQSDNWWSMQGVSAYTAGVTPASVVPLAHASSVSSKLEASASSQFQPSGHYQSAGNYLSASTVGFTDTIYTAVTSMSGVQLYGTDSAFNGVAVASGNGLWDTAIETAIVGTGHSQVAVHINGMIGQYFDVSSVDSAGSLLSRNTYDLDASGKTFVFPSASAISSLYINGNNYYRQYSYTASAFDITPLAHASALPTYQYDAEDKISSINGSAIAGGAGGGAEYSGIAPIHVDNDTHEISADVVNMDLQQITHDDTMVHVSNSASYALGVNYNYSGAPWNEGLVLKSGLLYSNNNPASGITSYALSDNVSSYYKLDVNFYDINDWHTRMECLIPSGILPSGTRGGYFNAVANLPNNVWFKCFRWSAIGTNWYCQVDEIAGTNGTNTPTFNVNQNANPPKVLSIVGWYKDSI